MKKLIGLTAAVLLVSCMHPEAGAQTAGARVLKDLEYARVGGIPLQLDLYLPMAGGPFPLTVYIHGGAFMRGDKARIWYSPMLLQPGRGYALASLNYRLSGQAPFPAAVLDVRAAIRWLRANAARYNLKADRIVVAGESAGGYLAVMLGTSGGVAPLEEENMGNLAQSSRVQGVIDFFGPTDLAQMDRGTPKSCGNAMVHGDADSPEARFLGCRTVAECPARATAANPIGYLSRTTPPFLIFHGTADCLVSPLQSRLLYDALRAAGLRATLFQYPDLSHADRRFLTPETEKRVNGFLDGILMP